MKKLKSTTASTVITIFVCTFLFGLIAHAYRYFNASYSHDSLMVHQDDTIWQISLGRYLQPVYIQLRGDLCAPFLLGMLSLLWLSLSICIISKILDLQSKIILIPLCGILSTNATMTLTNATFIPWADIFMLSLLFCVLAVYVYTKYKYGFLYGIFFICLSLSLYQSYYQTAIIFFMILIIKYIFDGHSFKFIFIMGIKALCTLLFGLLLYYVILKIVLSVKSIELAVNYNGIADVGNYTGVSIIQLIWDTYIYPIKYFLCPETYNNKITAVINCVIAALFGLGIIRVIYIKKISRINVMMLLALVILMPFGMNTVYFISKGMEHSLMIYSFFFVYVFALMILNYCCLNWSGGRQLEVKEAKWLKIYKTAVAVLMSIVIFNNIIFANQAYLKKDLIYQSTFTIMTRILDRIEQTEGYILNETPVVLVGYLNDSKLITDRNGFQEVTGTGMLDKSAVTYYHTYLQYYNLILGYPINLVSEAERNDFAQKEIVKNMPVFPDKDSCKIIDGYMVVKIS